jgi:Uma2 family endonuclease
MDTLQRPTTRRSTSLSPDAILHARERRLTVEEYHAMGDAGIFSEDDRVELLNGHLISMSPIGPSHAHCVNRLNELFVQRVIWDEQKRAQVGVQNPIRISSLSEPEPDVSLYDPKMPTDRHPGPNDLLLVVEVADSSVEYDRDVKAQAYGEAGIPEYWVVDLENEVVEVFRRPEADGYAERIRHRRGDDLSVTTLPDLDSIPVADVLGKEG